MTEEGETLSLENRAIDFFEGGSIQYTANYNSVDITLTITYNKRSEWKRGVDHIYIAKVEASGNSEYAKAKISWSSGSIHLTNSSFSEVISQMSDRANSFVQVCRHKDGSPSLSSYMRCVHSIEDQLKKDFKDPETGKLKDELRKYFRKKTPIDPNDLVQ